MVRWRLAERAGERGRHAPTPAFAAELTALLHGEAKHYAGRVPPTDAHVAHCNYERIAPGPCWDRIVGRRGERQPVAATRGSGAAAVATGVGAGGAPPMQVRGSLDRFL